MTCKEKILSNDYADIIITNIQPDEVELLNNVDYCASTIDDEFNIVYVSRQGIPETSIGAYTYAAIPDLYGLMQTFQAENLVAMGNIRIQNPPLSLHGRDVIIGFIDTGIRYQLDVFRDSEGNSRILSIWDQTIQSGEPPEGFLYGTEYTRDEINNALNAENPLDVVPSTDENGHGTAMASAAAGSIIDQGLTFRGAAPQADIVMVKVKGAKEYLREYYLINDDAVAFQENDIMEAVKYLDNLSNIYQKPVVIVLGIGTNLGNHRGDSPLGDYINKISTQRRRAIVVCGGNEGDKQHHYSGNVPDQVEIQVQEGTTGFHMELWGCKMDEYNVAVRTPGGEITPVIDFRNGVDRSFSFLFDRTLINISIVLVEPRSGEQLVFFRFRNPTPGIWSILVSPSEQKRLRGNGNFSIWLPITEFIDGGVVFLEPDPEVTLTEPANVERVISVSAYDGYSGGWFFESGRGFTGSGTVKPDLSAPGVRVSTALGERTGSSMAAALSAGCIAQFMEWAIVEGNAPMVEGRTIKGYFIRGAVRENNIIYPDPRWGYGKLNINDTFEVLARI
ncbi:MAG: S8 family peptidase [Lachnospiraceae bacterium]|nr:S8 family peptidase [Lachnospiraceae bacterium]